MSNEKRRQPRVPAMKAADNAFKEDPKMEAAKAIFNKDQEAKATKQALQTLYLATLPNNEQMKRAGAIIAAAGEQGQKKRDELKARVDTLATRDNVKGYVEQLLKLVADQEKANLLESITGEDKPGAKSYKTILAEKETKIRGQFQELSLAIESFAASLKEQPIDLGISNSHSTSITRIEKEIDQTRENLAQELYERIERKELPIQQLEEHGLNSLMQMITQENEKLRPQIEESRASFRSETIAVLQEGIKRQVELVDGCLMGEKINLVTAEKHIARVNQLLGALNEEGKRQINQELSQFESLIERFNAVQKQVSDTTVSAIAPVKDTIAEAKSKLSEWQKEASETRKKDLSEGEKKLAETLDDLENIVGKSQKELDKKWDELLAQFDTADWIPERNIHDEKVAVGTKDLIRKLYFAKLSDAEQIKGFITVIVPDGENKQAGIKELEAALKKNAIRENVTNAELEVLIKSYDDERKGFPVAEDAEKEDRELVAVLLQQLEKLKQNPDPRARLAEAKVEGALEKFGHIGPEKQVADANVTQAALAMSIHALEPKAPTTAGVAAPGVARPVDPPKDKEELSSADLVTVEQKSKVDVSLSAESAASAKQDLEGIVAKESKPAAESNEAEIVPVISATEQKQVPDITVPVSGVGAETEHEPMAAELRERLAATKKMSAEAVIKKGDEIAAASAAKPNTIDIGDLGKPGSVMYHLKFGYRTASRDISHIEYIKLLKEHEPGLHKLAEDRAKAGTASGKASSAEWWGTVKSLARERDFGSIIMTIGTGAALVARDIKGIGKLITSPRAYFQERREAALSHDIRNVSSELQNRVAQQTKRKNYIPGTASLGIELTRPLYNSVEADLKNVGKPGSDFNVLRQKYTGTPSDVVNTLVKNFINERGEKLDPAVAAAMPPPPFPPERAEQIAFKAAATADTTVLKSPAVDVVKPDKEPGKSGEFADLDKDFQELSSELDRLSEEEKKPPEPETSKDAFDELDRIIEEKQKAADSSIPVIDVEQYVEKNKEIQDRKAESQPVGTQKAEEGEYVQGLMKEYQDEAKVGKKEAEDKPSAAEADAYVRSLMKEHNNETKEDVDNIIQQAVQPVKANAVPATQSVEAEKKQNIDVVLIVQVSQKESVQKLFTELAPPEIMNWPLNKEAAPQALVKFSCSEKQVARLASEFAKLDPPPKVSDSSNVKFKDEFKQAAQTVSESKQKQAHADEGQKEAPRRVSSPK
jgi:hypothetical protein